MAFMVQTVVKKAPGTTWWAKANPEAAKRLAEFATGLNLVKRRRARLLDENTIGVRVFFEDEAAHAKYMAALETNSDFQARENWGASIGANKIEVSKVV